MIKTTRDPLVIAGFLVLLLIIACLETLQQTREIFLVTPALS